jgi:hypothetical protein
MSDSIPDGATPIGSKLYIFKSKSNSTDALISAHGGYYKGNKTFRVPEGVEIIFYGIHGNVLSDPGLKMTSTKAKVVETFSGGSSASIMSFRSIRDDMPERRATPRKPMDKSLAMSNRLIKL